VLKVKASAESTEFSAQSENSAKVLLAQRVSIGQVSLWYSQPNFSKQMFQMIKKPRHGPAIVDHMPQCLLPDNEWLQLQMFDRFRRMYC